MKITQCNVLYNYIIFMLPIEYKNIPGAHYCMNTNSNSYGLNTPILVRNTSSVTTKFRQVNQLLNKLLVKMFPVFQISLLQTAPERLQLSH
jgi:hypothetical protein